MKMHAFEGHLVYGGLHLAEALEHSRGILSRTFGQCSFFDQLQNVRQVPVGVRLHNGHMEFGGTDTAAFDPFEGDYRTGIERSQRLDDGGLIGAGIRQRAHQHVAADPGEPIQITQQGHNPSIMPCLVPQC